MFRKLPGLTLAFLAVPAFAGDISYNYAQFGYQKIDVDDQGLGFDLDGNGLGVAGSFEIGESWFVAIGHSQADLSFGIDYDRTSAGVGWHTTMSNSTDLYASLQYLRDEGEIAGLASFDDDGVGATIGVRGMVTDNIEIGGSVGYVDFGDSGDGMRYDAQVLYNFTDNFSVGLMLDVEEDLTRYGAGVRFYW